MNEKPTVDNREGLLSQTLRNFLIVTLFSALMLVVFADSLVWCVFFSHLYLINLLINVLATYKDFLWPPIYQYTIHTTDDMSRHHILCICMLTRCPLHAWLPLHPEPSSSLLIKNLLLHSSSSLLVLPLASGTFSAQTDESSPPSVILPPFFWTSFPLKCLVYYHPGTSLSSQGTQTSSCSTFNSSWSQGCLSLILSQTSAPAGHIHTDSISHYGCVLSALQIF